MIETDHTSSMTPMYHRRRTPPLRYLALSRAVVQADRHADPDAKALAVLDAANATLRKFGLRLNLYCLRDDAETVTVQANLVLNL